MHAVRLIEVRPSSGILVVDIPDVDDITSTDVIERSSDTTLKGGGTGAREQAR